MAYTKTQIQAKIEALELALTSRSKTVQYADRSVTYRDFNEIAQQIDYWRAKLRTRSKIVYARINKNLSGVCL